MTIIYSLKNPHENNETFNASLNLFACNRILYHQTIISWHSSKDNINLTFTSKRLILVQISLCDKATTKRNK